MDRHRTAQELEAGLADVRGAPPDEGAVELLVCRPAPGQRLVLDVAELTPELGLVGDGWAVRGSRHTADGSPQPTKQVTLVAARAIALVAGDRTRWALAGDQLYVDLDLSHANLPTGTRLQVGTAVVELTADLHRGCAKFRYRFGVDAARFVNSPAGRALRLRGANARVVEAGRVATGDLVSRC